MEFRTPEEEHSSWQESVAVVWEGAINMKDGNVNVRALDLTESVEFDLEMPSIIDVVGRIKPELVWDCVSQSRKMGTGDIVVFKFSPASDGDRETYDSFIRQMNETNRFSVIRPVNKTVECFFVLPLPKGSPIPLELATSEIKCNSIISFGNWFRPSRLNFSFIY